MSLLDRNISQLLKLMELNEVSSEEITKACIDNIEGDSDSRTFKIVLKDEGIRRAKEIDRRRKEKLDTGRLAGIPVAITDDISTKGLLTTAGSKILEKYLPPFDATVVKKLLDDDGIILGKLKVNEFALIPTDTMAEALDLKKAVFGLSTSMDRNKVSMKPTFGLISRYGVISATSSFDQVVPITNCVDDLALVLNTLEGHDKRDSVSIKEEIVDYREFLNTDIKDFKVAIPSGLVNDDINSIIGRLEKLGAIVQEVALSSLEYILPVYKILASAEFASISAKFDGISLGYRTNEYEDIDELYKKTRAEGFGKEAKKTILFGNHVISSGQYEKSYIRAQRIRGLIKDELRRIIGEYGLVLMPYGVKKDYDLVSNLAGLPAITIPNNIQLIGPYLGEGELIRLAYALESEGGGK